MPDHPTGTVTFLFTDVEASTQRWEQHRAWMEQAHARHEAILRAAIAAQGGWAYKQIGDAFQAAFQTAPAALTAAVAAQRALAAEPWGIRARSPCAWACTPAPPRSGRTTTSAPCSTA